MAPSRGKPRIASSRQKLRKTQKILLKSSEGARSCGRLDFGLLASRTVRQDISVVLSHLTCGRFLQRSQDIDAGCITQCLRRRFWVQIEFYLDPTRDELCVWPGVTHLASLCLGLPLGC